MKNTPFAIELKGNQFFVDNSTLSTITSCPRKGAYSALAKRREVKSRMALFFGGAIHKALEVRDLEQTELCTPVIEDKMIQALVDYYQDCQDVDDYRNLAYAIHTIQEYNKVWKYDPLKPITLPDGELAVEIPFALSLGLVHVGQELWVSDPDINDGEPQLRYIDTIEVIFTGKIDRITEKNGALTNLDHKTTSIGGPTFFDEFYTSHQFRGYKWAAQLVLGKPIQGVVINALMCRPPLKSGNVNYTFDRHEIHISDEQVEDWQESFLSILSQFFQQCVGQLGFEPTKVEQAFPMYTNSCITKYGRCEFFQVCQLTPSHRSALLFSGLYETNSWNPLEGEDGAKPKPNSAFVLPGLFK